MKVTLIMSLLLRKLQTIVDNLIIKLMKKVILYILCVASFVIYAQDRVLFSISDVDVSVDDFLKNYDKNRLDSDTLSFEDSLQEYLDLYIKFKLKVIEAESLGLDTLPSFLRELDGYRSQLVKPYLTDREVSEQLLQEAYERLKYEVSVRHILIQTSGDDTIQAYNKILSIKKKLDNGANFIELANQFSEDPSVKDNEGDLGYFSALYMVYPFESAAYNTPVGSISDPVKTRFGYHLLQVNDKRNSRGEVKVAHILIRKNEGVKSVNPKEKINEIYDSLMLGQDFSELAKQFSDDKKSGSKGGELDWFGANKMVKSFEEVAFSLDSINSISQPFETEFGWHIVKFLDKKYLPSFNEIKESLKKQVERDSRSQKTRNIVLNRLENEWGFVENKKVKNMCFNLIGDDADVSTEIKEKGQVLFLFNNQYDASSRYVYQKDFIDFFNSFRTRLNKKTDMNTVKSELYDTFKAQKILEIESNNLESKYDEFRLLYREYHDGILMYQLQKEKVWDKAVEDTLGLFGFYENNQSNYMWDNRLYVKIYSAKNNKIAQKVLRKIKWGTKDDDLLKDFNKTSALNLSIEELTCAKGDNNLIDETIFNVEDFDFHSLKIGDSYSTAAHQIILIEDILPRSVKSLNEIKGVVISDYQSFLETEWLNELSQKYNVIINEDLFLLAQNKEVNILEENSITSNQIDDQSTFEKAFEIAVKKLGSSKDVYFGWNGNIYNTELQLND
ncbi:MAG: hypothetical protein CMD23_00185 [Flavobacteriales bacterium]|nr:hypothetical protein [Flavobacteriales bacterium]